MKIHIGTSGWQYKHWLDDVSVIDTATNKVIATVKQATAPGASRCKHQSGISIRRAGSRYAFPQQREHHPYS